MGIQESNLTELQKTRAKQAKLTYGVGRSSSMISLQADKPKAQAVKTPSPPIQPKHRNTVNPVVAERMLPEKVLISHTTLYIL